MLGKHRCLAVVALVLGLTASCVTKTETVNLFTSGRAQNGDVQVAYVARGVGEPAIVLIHGWSCDRRVWDRAARRLSLDYRVVTLDLGGHGESSAAREEWTIPAFASDVTAVVNELGLNRVILVGHSMGGPVAVEAALRLPGKVVGIIGVDTFLDVEMKVPYERIEDIVRPMHEDFETSVRTNLKQSYFHEDADPALVNAMGDMMASANEQVAIPAMFGMYQYDLPGAMALVAVPIRCINGDLNPVNLEAARRHSKDFAVITMGHCGHFPMQEYPSAFNDHLADTIAALDG